MDLPDLIDSQIILQDREDLDSPAFQGTDFNTTFNTTTSALQLTDPSVVKTGIYTQNGTTITIDLQASNNILVGETLNFRFTTGESISGLYTVVQILDSTRFTITASNSIGTIGAVSIDLSLIHI